MLRALAASAAALEAGSSAWSTLLVGVDALLR